MSDRLTAEQLAYLRSNYGHWVTSQDQVYRVTLAWEVMEDLPALLAAAEREGRLREASQAVVYEFVCYPNQPLTDSVIDNLKAALEGGPK